MTEDDLSVGARELLLYIENDGALYRSQHTPINKNLATKKAKGDYDREKAEKLFMYLVDAGAKKYAKEFGGGEWNRMFPVPDRKQVAKALRHQFESYYSEGAFHKMLPKKYQPGAKAPRARSPKVSGVMAEKGRSAKPKASREYRCTLPGMYPPGSHGHEQASQRQGHYVHASSALEAAKKLLESHPGQDEASVSTFSHRGGMGVVKYFSRKGGRIVESKDRYR